jgi:UDP-3-O-[3-hydroxymyristoyl] glucosamine N-acyltransferase
MAQPTFFEHPPWSTLADLAALTTAQLADPAKAGQPVRGLASLDEAGPMHLTFFDNPKYAGLLASTTAGACLVSQRFEASVPAHVTVLRATEPFREFVKIARELYRDALRPQSCCGYSGIAPSAVIDPTAHLEDDVIVDPLAVIGPNVEIGAGTVIGAGAVISANVRIGRDCNVGARTSVQYALIGNNVVIHPGCSIGQDGYGFVFFGPDRHLKVPQTGRVLIQNDVEIGAGSTIDRGSLRDTVIGEGTKIDNQVQIGHNVTIGRHCLLAAQIGLAGNLSIGDNVALGAKVGIDNHLRIGDGAKVTAISAVKDDIPADGRWGGTADSKGEGRE